MPYSHDADVLGRDLPSPDNLDMDVSGLEVVDRAQIVPSLDGPEQDDIVALGLHRSTMNRGFGA